MKVRTLALVVLLALVVGAVIVYAIWPPWVPLPFESLVVRRRASSKVQWRAAFYREHPGEKPLNWAIADKAVAFREAEPMGKFVLHKNDCSDFMEAVVDDALGAKARFKRGSDQHILTRQRHLWDTFYWDGRTPLLPGDQIFVRHSPHYPPKAMSIGHCGLIGADGMVYDWSKLKSWRTPRYGRNSVEWFTRHSPPPHGVVICRLKAQYRYKARPVLAPGA